MVKMQSMVEDEGFHDNMSHVLLDQSKRDNMEEGEEELIQALEDKYDALKDKLIEAVSDWQLQHWHHLQCINFTCYTSYCKLTFMCDDFILQLTRN